MWEFWRNRMRDLFAFLDQYDTHLNITHELVDVAKQQGSQS